MGYIRKFPHCHGPQHLELLLNRQPTLIPNPPWPGFYYFYKGFYFTGIKNLMSKRVSCFCEFWTFLVSTQHLVLRIYSQYKWICAFLTLAESSTTLIIKSPSDKYQNRNLHPVNRPVDTVRALRICCSDRSYKISIKLNI